MTEFVAHQYDDFQTILEALNKERKYLNYGYRKSRSDSYEQKQEQLCTLVYDAAEIQPHHILIDVGFGSGEQDFLLANRYQFAALHGFNIASSQVEYAQGRAAALGLKKLHFHHGQAESMAVMASGQADRVMAVECAFYFDRSRFYAEAARVLKPGGLLVLADITFSDRLKAFTRLADDLERVGYLGKNQESWEKHFHTRRLQTIHRETIPGAQQTVGILLRMILKHFRWKDRQAYRTLWKMAVSTQITVIGFLTRLIRYDLIVLEKK